MKQGCVKLDQSVRHGHSTVTKCGSITVSVHQVSDVSSLIVRTETALETSVY
jgi:hypothetical protein